jgi:amphi-Trp domain-containing protein
MASERVRDIIVEDSEPTTYTIPERIGSCMPEEVLFESESAQSRNDIAAMLRRVADNLEAGDAITLRAGDESVTMDPPDRPTFEVKAEREGPADGPGELSVEFEIEWDENGESGSLEIE